MELFFYCVFSIGLLSFSKIISETIHELYMKCFIRMISIMVGRKLKVKNIR